LTGNGVYGFRIFDAYTPAVPAVFRDLTSWRNGKNGMTITNIGCVGFDGFKLIQNNRRSYNARAVTCPHWGKGPGSQGSFISNTLSLDVPDPAVFPESVNTTDKLGRGPMLNGAFFMPWGTPGMTARRGSAEHLIATKALCCTAAAWMLIVAQCSANF